MNLSIRKGTFPTYSPDITFTNVSGQYTISATLTNSSGTNTYSQVLFYWAAAVVPTTSPQLFGWSLGAYIQPITSPPEPNPTPNSPGLLIPSGTSPGTYWNSTIWVPDAAVSSTIASSADTAHIMIIAQVIQVSPSMTAHPTDFNWWPGTNTWVAAGIFSWP
jgi:hypothetical protein